MITFFKRLYQNVQGKFVRHYREAGDTHNLIFHSAATLTLTSALSYALGLVRDKTFAYRFGASLELDIYNASFVIPDLLFATLVSGALSAAFVPIFTGLDEKSRTKAFSYMGQVISWLLLVLGFLSLIFAIALPAITPYLVPGFSDEARLMYISTTRLMLISPILFTLSNTFGYALISTRDFFWYGLSPVVYNVGIVFGVLVLVPWIGFYGLVTGTLIGALLHLLMRARVVWQYGFRLYPSLVVTQELKETVWLMLPRLVQIGSWQLMLSWFIMLASRTGEGGVTIYNFAYNFQSVPVSLIGIAIALASFAKLSHLSAHGDLGRFKIIVKQESVKIFSLTLLAGLALWAISYPLVNFFLGGGKFGNDAVRLTALLLSVYAISVPLESLMHLLSRAHYALKNTLRPALIQIGSIAVAMYLSSALLPTIGLFAIPLAFSAGFALQCLGLAYSLSYLLRRQ